MSSTRIWHRVELDPAALTRGEANSLAAHLGIVITEIGNDFVTAAMPVKAGDEVIARFDSGLGDVRTAFI